MVEGQHHHVSAQHLNAYANHAAWLIDHGMQANGAVTNKAIGLTVAHPVSLKWKGYGQR